MRLAWALASRNTPRGKSAKEIRELWHWVWARLGCALQPDAQVPAYTLAAFPPAPQLSALLGVASCFQSRCYSPVLSDINLLGSGSGSLINAFPERSRYMHRKTHEKLRRKGLIAEQRALSVIAGNLARIRFMAANIR